MMNDKRKQSDGNGGDGADLLWDCFVNWAETLEKIQGDKKANRKS